MSKKKDIGDKSLDNTDSLPELESSEPVAAKEKSVSKPVMSPPVAKPRQNTPKVLTFEQWAKMRKIRAQHIGGLKAYCKNVKKRRTLEEWDEIFKAY